MIEVRKFRRHFTQAAEEIRTERLQADIGQAALARAIGKRRNWLCMRENGIQRLRPKDVNVLREAMKRIIAKRQECKLLKTNATLRTDI